MQEITTLAAFLCLHYVEAWITSPLAFDAPKNDLLYYKSLTANIELMKQNQNKYPKGFQQLFEAMKTKLENHLWYLSESLVVLGLFSDKVSVYDKQAMAKVMLKNKNDSSASTEMLMPTMKPSTHLKDLVGSDSWMIFKLLNISGSFLSERARLWADNDEYQSMKDGIHSLKVVNDSAERALGLVTEFHSNKITKDPQQKQFLYQVVKDLRREQAKLAEEVGVSDTSSKKVLSCLNW